MRLAIIGFSFIAALAATGCTSAGNDFGRTDLATKSEPSSSSAPEFAGVASVTAVDATRATVQWAAAKDDTTPAAVIAYRIYVAPSAAELTYSTPFATSPAGATSYGIVGLPAARTSAVVVRAVDAQGNEDTNTRVVTVTTAALPAPVLTVKSVLQPAASLLVAWDGPSNTALTTATGLHFELCWGTTADACSTFVPMRATAENAVDLGVHGLATRTTYFVTVRTVDRLGTASEATTASATTATSYATDVVPMLKTSCNTCHNGAYAPGPMTRSWLLGRSAGTPGGTAPLKCGSTTAMLTPFDPAQSLLYTKMTAAFSCGVRMPAKGIYDAVHDAHTSIVFDWITQGAANN